MFGVQLDVGVRVATKLGQDVVLVGSHPTMGSWSIDDALPLQWTDGHVWRASIELPPDCAEVEYKVCFLAPVSMAQHCCSAIHVDLSPNVSHAHTCDV